MGASRLIVLVRDGRPDHGQQGPYESKQRVDHGHLREVGVLEVGGDMLGEEAVGEHAEPEEVPVGDGADQVVRDQEA